MNKKRSDFPNDRKDKTRKRFFIVCEGEKTEPNYFKKFSVDVDIQLSKGEGKDTKSLVEKSY